MKNSMRWILLFFILLMLVSCNSKNNDKQALAKYLDSTEETERRYFTDESAEEEFANQFRILDIVEHSVYTVDNELNINFTFNKSVTRSNILNCRSYFMKHAVLKDSKYGGLPYQEVINENISYDSSIIRIFIDDKLVIYEKYNRNENKFDYYENTEIKLDARSVKNQTLNSFASRLKKVVKNKKDIKVVHPLKGNVILFKISTKENLKDNEIELIKTLVEEELSLKNKSQAGENSKINTEYLGIGIELYTQNSKYAEYTYSNGETKDWIHEDWMNYDFYK
ncbi:hypothetical protein [Oceanirhabdus sp. W0125-5]|uniref:hypothetical protein n=1 Tax=Oceanirhabdus sp. W0125-5 TaxID=2999116 RepID=UPI0022F2F178|nr:hypothetical protein [Oceanirhabdus sp. W0125-5]WBW95406.1 hypothetical protein OW730_17140 [Oceanirhabdus sp. W0125-5]